MIFKIPKPRDRLMVELMARGGLRIGEVLKLRARDVEDQKLTLESPKSGKPREVVFIPQKIAQRLENYIRERGFDPHSRIFPLSSTGLPGTWWKGPASG